jgi:hypothetical protein
MIICVSLVLDDCSMGHVFAYRSRYSVIGLHVRLTTRAVSSSWHMGAFSQVDRDSTRMTLNASFSHYLLAVGPDIHRYTEKHEMNDRKPLQ